MSRCNKTFTCGARERKPERLKGFDKRIAPTAAQIDSVSDNGKSLFFGSDDSAKVIPPLAGRAYPSVFKFLSDCAASNCRNDFSTAARECL